MTWEQLYPIVKEQAHYAVLRYEEPERRKDKCQELVCQSYDLYKSYIERGKPIKKQDFKCFVTQRCKQLDIRGFVKKKGGGVSTLDALGYYRRRPDSPTPVIEFADWMTITAKSKQKVEDNIVFNIDYQDWLAKLTVIQKRILNYLIQGYKVSKIAERLRTSAKTIKDNINELRRSFTAYFHIQQHKGLSFT
jgi:hypothetical protein